MKKTLLWLFLWTLVLPLISQTPEENAVKYRYFRQRLNSEMMLFTGDASVKGSHLPMERRYLYRGERMGHWGDAVWWQGHYLAVLATEYALKQRDGENTAATLRELRLALDVYRRLDLSAERCFGDTTPQELNGFYIRDDVGREMAPSLKVRYVNSDYTYYCGHTDARRNAPSQDQAWASYLGFALIQKLVDDTLLHREVAELAGRMVRGMQYTDGNGRAHWQIMNPVTGAVVQKEGDIQWLQYAHGEIGTRLAGRNLHAGRSDKPQWRNTWNLLQQNVLIDRDGHFTWYGVLSLAAVLNDGAGRQDCYQWMVETCDKVVRRRPDMQQSLIFPHLPLINLVLHGTEGRELLPKERYEAYLNAAPASGCITSEVGGEEVRTAAPWHSLSLFCPWHTSVTGDANMLDYMLLYNLYRLVYEN
jgi:hypothetical protein